MSVTRGDGWFVQQPDDEADEIIVGLADSADASWFVGWFRRSFSPEEAQKLSDALLDKIGEA